MSLDVCIRGGGAVGRSLALALSRRGFGVALQESAPHRSGPDVRTYALNAASVELLRRLKVWDRLPEQGAATPVYEMQVQGDGGGQLRFSAWEQGVSELAWIVDAAALDEVLDQAIGYAPHVERVGSDRSVDARLLAVCEGKASATRDALGVEFERRPYGHHGVAARLTCESPHAGQAWQWFLPPSGASEAQASSGPEILALLPFDRPAAGQGYGLVWSVSEARAQELLALPAEDFELALQLATGGRAGPLHLASERASWPLALSRARTWSGPGWVLLGDAAHQVHPLSGQGLNLGLADVIALERVLCEREPWRELSDPRLLARYARERLGPTLAMGWMTDGLWHLFSAQALPWPELRNRGLSLVHHLKPLKRWLTARALES